MKYLSILFILPFILVNLSDGTDSRQEAVKSIDDIMAQVSTRFQLIQFCEMNSTHVYVIAAKKMWIKCWNLLVISSWKVRMKQNQFNNNFKRFSLFIQSNNVSRKNENK